MSLYSVFNDYFNQYYIYITVAIVLVIFIMIGYYSYVSMYADKQSMFNNVSNMNDRNNELIIYFFHVDWCPHCKKALPAWNEFSEKYNKQNRNGYTINCIDMDCTKETPEITEIINTYKVVAYPNVKMVKDGTVIDFDSKITESSLEKFVESMV